MTVFSFKFSLAISLEILNNNKKEWKNNKSQQITFCLDLGRGNLCYLFYMSVYLHVNETEKYLIINTIILLYTTFSNRFTTLCG